MTREELANMTGETVEDGEYALNLILKHVKPEFIKMCIKARHTEVIDEIDSLRKDGIIARPNGIDVAYWNPCMSDEEEKKYYRATNLLYERNRLNHLLSAMLYHRY